MKYFAPYSNCSYTFTTTRVRKIDSCFQSFFLQLNLCMTLVPLFRCFDILQFCHACNIVDKFNIIISIKEGKQSLKK